MSIECRKRIDTEKPAGGGRKTALRGFSFAPLEREPMRDFAAGIGGCPEMAALRRRLDLVGAEHCERCDAEVMGRECLMTCFESPVGTVRASSAPGTVGYLDGLLEACCQDVDTVGRAMTARQVMEWYGAVGAAGN